MQKNKHHGETLALRASVKRSHIAYLAAVIESYEGLAMMRTLDPGKGIICFYAISPLSQEVVSLLHSLQEETGFAFLAPPRGFGGPA